MTVKRQKVAALLPRALAYLSPSSIMTWPPLALLAALLRGE